MGKRPLAYEKSVFLTPASPWAHSLTSLKLLEYLILRYPSSATQKPLGFPSTQLLALLGGSKVIIHLFLARSTELLSLVLGPPVAVYDLSFVSLKFLLKWGEVAFFCAHE